MNVNVISKMVLDSFIEYNSHCRVICSMLCFNVGDDGGMMRNKLTVVTVIMMTMI